ncbi:hypothetical protein GCM10009754_55270 [Amycolatopsis minnesotensis]|uniref:Uncharacterized protein n=1 Tax=Amycolatopsis minnesotensis TaxID=337894 RepID=A0ABN2RQW2_9PSEU
MLGQHPGGIEDFAGEAEFGAGQRGERMQDRPRRGRTLGSRMATVRHVFSLPGENREPERSGIGGKANSGSRARSTR